MAARRAVIFVNLNCCSFPSGHGADGLVDHRKKGFAAEFALIRGHGSNLVAFNVVGFQ